MGNRIEQLLAMLSSEPNDLFLHYALALEYISMGKQEKGIDQLKQIILRNADYLPAYHKLGDLFFSEGSYPEAIEVLETGIKKAAQGSKAKLEMQALLQMAREEME
ncbi:MAG: tetratricopeptide repeat protein [Bacteroidota bacterium]|jgi:tetratricopeptide (TPR) repeat protein